MSDQTKTYTQMQAEQIADLSKRLAEQQEKLESERENYERSQAAYETTRRLQHGWNEELQRENALLKSHRDSHFKDYDSLSKKLDTAERRLAEVEAALREQWEYAHADHCSNLEDSGHCKNENSTGVKACKWPVPEALKPADPERKAEQRERGCFHCKHFVGYHHAGKIDGQCTVKYCRCVNYQTATEVIQEERERLDEARRGLVRAGERRERAEAALRAIRGGKNSCIAWLQSKEHVSAYFSPNAIADIDSVYMAVVAEEALKSVSSDPKE